MNSIKIKYIVSCCLLLAAGNLRAQVVGTPYIPATTCATAIPVLTVSGAGCQIAPTTAANGMQLSVANISGATYQWTVPTGSGLTLSAPNSATTRVYITDANTLGGNFTVSVTVSSPCATPASRTASASIQILPLPNTLARAERYAKLYYPSGTHGVWVAFQRVNGNPAYFVMAGSSTNLNATAINSIVCSPSVNNGTPTLGVNGAAYNFPPSVPYYMSVPGPFNTNCVTIQTQTVNAPNFNQAIDANVCNTTAISYASMIAAGTW
jgi:hypothetical protein